MEVLTRHYPEARDTTDSGRGSLPDEGEEAEGDEDDADAGQPPPPAFAFLETILEETSDDLRSESDRDRDHRGWADSSDSDAASSVIRVGASGDWGSERESSSTSSRRRRRRPTSGGPADDTAALPPTGADGLLAPPDDDGALSLSSRSSSLLQFESLERHCEDVFRASATTDPFHSPASPSQFSFDSLESTRWRFSASPDSLDECECSSDSEGGSDDTLRHSSWSSLRSSGRLRSFRSFDSLNLIPTGFMGERKSPAHGGHASDATVVAIMMKAAACAGNGATVVASVDLTGGASERERTDAAPPTGGVKPPQRSAENLSEDSGFGDHVRGAASGGAGGGDGGAGDAASEGAARRVTDDADVDDVVDDSCSSCYSDSSDDEFSSFSAPPSSPEAPRHQLQAKKKKRQKKKKQLKLASRPARQLQRGWEARDSKYSPVGGREGAAGWQSAPSLMLGDSPAAVADAREGGRAAALAKLESDVFTAVAHYQASGQHPFAAPPLHARAAPPRLRSVPAGLHLCAAASDARGDERRDDARGAVSDAADSSSSSSDAADDGLSSPGDGDDFNASRDTVVAMNASRATDVPFARKMAAGPRGCPVAATSTPNLVSAEFLRREREFQTSTVSIPLKDDADAYLDTAGVGLLSKSLTPLPSTGSNKGVHFCPVVAEVSWRDSFSDDERERSVSSSEEERGLEAALCAPEDDLLDDESSSCSSEGDSAPPESFAPPAQPQLQRLQVGVPAAGGRRERLVVELGAPPPPPPSPQRLQPPERAPAAEGHVTGGRVGLDIAGAPPVAAANPSLPPQQLPHPPRSPRADVSAARPSQPPPPPPPSPPIKTPPPQKRDMEEQVAPAAAATSAPPQKKSRFGHFFQRFSFRRLSGSKKDDVKKKKEKKSGTGTSSKTVTEPPHYEDVKIIPLHPEDSADSGGVPGPSTGARAPDVVAAKPPLPPSRSSASVSPSRRQGAGPAPATPATPATPTGARGPALPRADHQQGQQRQQQRADSAIDRGASAARGGAGGGRNGMVPAGLLETDLDTSVTTTQYGAAAAAAGKKARSLQYIGPVGQPRGQGLMLQLPPGAGAGASAGAAAPATVGAPAGGAGAETASAHMHLAHHGLMSAHHGGAGAADARAKSMEFLLDKENQAAVQPPENELQKGAGGAGGGAGERTLSEHQLRVQRSLQRLHVPDWYKNSAVAAPGFLLRRSSADAHHWPGLASKTTSLSSLGGGAGASGPTSAAVSPSPQATGAHLVSAGLGGSSTPAGHSPTGQPLLSPSPIPHSGGSFSRWSTSRLCGGSATTSASTSPGGSARSSFNYRQPYLGWRSQERLARPRTPAERLAAGLLAEKQASATAAAVAAAAAAAAASSPSQQHSPLTPRGGDPADLALGARASPDDADYDQTPQVPNLSEVRTSIKEVTSAIVHYVSGVRDDGSAEALTPSRHDSSISPRSTSPRGSGRLYWVESSFVGSRPLDSPETPLSLASSDPTSKMGDLYLELNKSQGFSQLNDAGGGEITRAGKSEVAFGEGTVSRPSPSSTTLEDVLDSLLGLPAASSRSPSPGPGRPQQPPPAPPLPPPPPPRRSCGDLHPDLAGSASDGEMWASGILTAPYYVSDTLRRRSEGSDPGPRPSTRLTNTALAGRARRVSFDMAVASPTSHLTTTNSPERPPSSGANTMQGDEQNMVRCRYGKCGRSAPIAEARRCFKTCHNCEHVYCSRECRRAHWERHRKTCLHSRVGALCRQVLSAVKEDAATLRHVSLLARRGYLAQGRGAVKLFFSSPDLAERFVAHGLPELGEPVYARWADLLPAEMGADLYSELLRLCKTYNPESRLVLYVAVCVVSEAPASGAVKWERQLVSRCSKMRLCRSLMASIASGKQQTQTPPPPPVPQRHSSPCSITRDMENPETLILTSLPGCEGQMSPKRAREISFTNIQRHLRQRGVSLRRHFPDVYKRLCAYVEGTSERFTPVTIYPCDAVTGKNFMCIIMPDAEPERLELVPRDSSCVKTIDISKELEST